MITHPSEELLHQWNKILCQRGLSMRRGSCLRMVSYTGTSNDLVKLEGRRYGCDLRATRSGPRLKMPRRQYTAWLPRRSDFVSCREQELARIAELLWDDLKTPEIAEQVKRNARSVRRDVRFLLKFERPFESDRFPQFTPRSHREEYAYAD